MADRSPVSRRFDNVPAVWLRVPVLRAVAAQILAGVIVFGGAALARKYLGQITPVPGLVLGQGGMACLIGAWFGLARWWAPLNLFLPWAAYYSLQLALPPWLYLAAFFLTVAVFWNAAGERIPLFLTNAKTWAALEDLIPAAQDTSVVDLGSGLGGTLGHLSKRFPGHGFLGVETAPVPYWISKIRLSGHDNVTLRYGDFWDVSLEPFNVVYCFLSPVPMERLYAKAKEEMRTGSLFVSNSFDVPGSPADEVREVADRRQTKLHIWRM